MSEYTQGHDRKAIGYFWILSGLVIFIGVSLLVWVGRAVVRGDPNARVWPSVALIVIFAWNLYRVNGRVVRSIRVKPDGLVELSAPLQRRAVKAADIEYLGPAFSKDFLELRYAGGRSFLLDSMSNLDGFEADVRRFNPTFRGRQ